MTHVWDNWEEERNSDDGKEDAEYPARHSDWSKVTIANGCEDGDHKEDGLAVVPVDMEVLAHNIDEIIDIDTTILIPESVYQYHYPLPAQQQPHTPITMSQDLFQNSFH